MDHGPTPPPAIHHGTHILPFPIFKLFTIGILLLMYYNTCAVKGDKGNPERGKYTGACHCFPGRLIIDVKWHPFTALFYPEQFPGFSFKLFRISHRNQEGKII